MFKKIFITFLLFFISNNIKCQNNKFSLQLNYLSNIIFQETQYNANIYTIKKNMIGGFDFGMIINTELNFKNKKSFFELESGITYSKVKYLTTLDLNTNSKYNIETNFRTYNIPLQFIIKVKLKDKVTGKMGIGNIISICPSDIYSEYVENNDFINNEFYEISYYTNRLQNNLTSSLGVNYKNDKHEFYFGIKVIRPYKKTEFSTIYFDHIKTGEQQIILDLYKNLFVFEIKYYLP